jgi:hypothetical protein
MNEDLGLCSAAGPCEPMQIRIEERAVRLLGGRLAVGDYRVRDCPWCGADLPEAVLASRPWRDLLQRPPAPPSLAAG